MSASIVLVVVAVFMLGMVGIGLSFARRQTTTEAYFVAGRSIPGWAAGMSLFATLVSSVSFIAYPGAGYEGKWWASFVPVLSAPLQAVVVIAVLIPVYRKVISISLYEYIERRFDRFTRIYSTLMFLLLNFAKSAFVFYLVGVTAGAITGWDVRAVIVAVGLITVLYTLIGGLEAVIWTDVVQGIILWIGGFVALAYVLLLSSGGFERVVSVAAAGGKFDFGDVSLALGQPTLVMLLMLGLFEGLQKSAGDQAIVQRYLAARSRWEASTGVVLSAALSLLAAILFTFLGTSLWSFYRMNPSLLPDSLGKSEEVFPHFLDTQLPPLFGAVVIAALLSAAMSTVSSVLNGFAAVGVEDYYRLMRPRAVDRERLAVGRWLVMLSGLLCIGIALVLVRTRGTVIQLWYVIASIISAGTLGIFLLAVLSRRASCPGVYAGIAAAVAFTMWATLTLNLDPDSAAYQTFDLGFLEAPVHSYLIGITSTVLFLIVGYSVSCVYPETNDAKRALTYWECN